RDEVTQQNAALVEESTAAATSMVEQARALERLMSFFTIDENGSETDNSGANESMGAKKLFDRRSPDSPLRKIAKPAIVKSSAKLSPANGKFKSTRLSKATNSNVADDLDWKEF
ncbi:MAG: methyl-accepting chemotaxis protein, partial [Pseudomonadota bacterium]